ncbi:DUF3048 domain-containing protein [Candidatus Uhrbacteria bacterium]|nr:DUF3048 domain-containing protein [Candidatus Uhrbacteria bacterium]
MRRLFSAIIMKKMRERVRRLRRALLRLQRSCLHWRSAVPRWAADSRFWGGVGVLLLVVVLVVARQWHPRSPPVIPPASPAPVHEIPVMPVPPPPPIIHRWTDGAPLVFQDAQPFAVAVVIDNAPEARPQSGLSEAPMVFEVPVEGRRTRFVAVLPFDQAIDAFGPVRSARPYAIGIAQHLGISLAHVGGSPEALTLFRELRIPHVNQYYDPPFWRSRFRHAPFNVYTSVARMREFLRVRGSDPSAAALAPLLPFVMDAGIADASDVPSLRFAYGPQHVVEWRFDATRGLYERSQGGRVHRDASGKTITATNVIVLHARSRVLDAVGRLRIPALDPRGRAAGDGGDDAATVCVHGRCVDGHWTWHAAPRTGSASPESRIQFWTGTKSARGDTPIAIRPGVTWVEVVDQSMLR